METICAEYCMHIDKATAQECVSSTWLNVFDNISEEFEISSPRTMMVGTIVTSVVMSSHELVKQK